MSEEMPIASEDERELVLRKLVAAHEGYFNVTKQYE